MAAISEIVYLKTAAIEKAMKLDSANKAVERGSLVIRNVPDGAVLQFQLVMPKLSVDDPVQEHVWDGTPFSLQFFASVPDDANIETIPAKLLVSGSTRPEFQPVSALRIAAKP